MLADLLLSLFFSSLLFYSGVERLAKLVVLALFIYLHLRCSPAGEEVEGRKLESMWSWNTS